jgi:hypothetical protein
MASKQQVRQYLAYWFQAGKQVLIHNGREALLPQPVIQGDRYSDEFETCWQQVIGPHHGDCYLEGTDQTVDKLLSPEWDIHFCARCEMPVPIAVSGSQVLCCPCHDLPLWPNDEVPSPRSPVDSRAQLVQIRDRLMQSRISQKTSQTSEQVG